MDNDTVVNLEIPRSVLCTALFAVERRVHLMGVNVEDCEDCPSLRQVWLEQQSNAVLAYETLRSALDQHDYPPNNELENLL